jgi:hypothetical protein
LVGLKKKFKELRRTRQWPFDEARFGKKLLPLHAKTTKNSVSSVSSVVNKISVNLCNPCQRTFAAFAFFVVNIICLPFVAFLSTVVLTKVEAYKGVLCG